MAKKKTTKMLKVEFQPPPGAASPAAPATPSGIGLLVRENTTFTDDTLYLSGHAYVNCKFLRCTLIIRPGLSHIAKCHFDSCVWHIDAVIHDQTSLALLRDRLIPIMEKSVISAGPPAPPPQVSQGP